MCSLMLRGVAQVIGQLPYATFEHIGFLPGLERLRSVQFVPLLETDMLAPGLLACEAIFKVQHFCLEVTRHDHHFPAKVCLLFSQTRGRHNWKGYSLT